MRACDGPLKSASRIAIRCPRARSARGQVQRQRALADAALAGPDGDEVPHGGEAARDPGALLDDLFEHPRAAVADDVVVALHQLPRAVAA
jgi:hypothetical protein